MHGIFGRRGATLLEVLIAIMVTTMLSGVVLLYGSGGRKQVNIYVETVKLAQVILKAKAQAISIYYNPSSLTCGYGVKIDSSQNTYATFRYTAADATGCANLTTLDPDGIQEIEHFTLSKNIAFGNAAGQVDQILFVPPDPRTYLWSNGEKVSISGEIHLLVDDGSTDKAVTISTGGQISY